MSRQLFTLPPISDKVTLSKRPASAPALSTLRPSQLRVFDGIMEFLNSEGGGMAVLAGAGGTGKTYITSRIIEAYLVSHWQDSVVFAATTNRAVKVSYRSTEFRHPNLDYGTIHRELAMKETVLPDGTLDFFPDKYLDPSIAKRKVAFIDESSQFSRKLWGYLLPYVDAGLKVVFIGDNYQTPPIKETDSVVFNKQTQRQNNMLCFELTEIVRQAADNPIIELTTYLRNNMGRNIHPCKTYDYVDNMWQGDRGVSFLKSNSRADRGHLDSILKHIFTSENFKASADFGRVVCWRNATADSFNSGIRRMIYGKGKLRRIEPGEKLITKAPIFNPCDTNSILLGNGNDLEVISMERREESINNGQFILPYYETKVEYSDMYDDVITETINIPTDMGMIAQKKILEILADSAKAYTKGSLASSRAWGEFYNFKKQFAEVGYSYAGTVHLSQGSTFQNAVVLAFDIVANFKLAERNKILYTACSRPSDRLFII